MSSGMLITTPSACASCSDRSGTQNFQPDGAAGHVGSGRHPGGGTQPGA
ncbi:MAG TPA: hypothetical protein VK903_09725 [Propionicimonas sp.]|nr:hypothetical protein [Propionicimonas sp.]